MRATNTEKLPQTFELTPSGSPMVIVGCIVVLVAVLVGFTMAGGHVGALIHPSEFITIGGAAFGALIVMSPKKVLVDVFKSVLQLLKGSPYNRAAYVELFKLLYVLAKLVRRDGMLALDSHISSPKESPIFARYPKISHNHHAMDFLLTALGLMGDGGDSEKLLAALEEEMKVIDREHHAAVSALARTADALPGFGIVAAVLGIVVTMEAIGGPVEEIGHKVGAALVGTFLGILMSYGFIAPMAGRMEYLGEAEMTFFRTIASAVAAMTEGAGPSEVVARARRVVSTDCRPTHDDMKAIAQEEVGV
ncbi:MAG: flagellar motor stator protein MotA [Gemmataceae bacterium]|nr:flagellar motor stator protein MotA [Gemmataceae bacterium]